MKAFQFPLYILACTLNLNDQGRTSGHGYEVCIWRRLDLSRYFPSRRHRKKPDPFGFEPQIYKMLRGQESLDMIPLARSLRPDETRIEHFMHRLQREPDNSRCLGGRVNLVCHAVILPASEENYQAHASSRSLQAIAVPLGSNIEASHWIVTALWLGLLPVDQLLLPIAHQ